MRRHSDNEFPRYELFIDYLLLLNRKNILVCESSKLKGNAEKKCIFFFHVNYAFYRNKNGILLLHFTQL